MSAKKSAPRASGINIAAPLLRWYDKNRRTLPWRALPGQTPDPYGVWLSEIMLQQTTVAAVIPYYQRFLTRWPSVQDLAKAKRDDVLAQWAGLGYYSRARNLHACAQILATLPHFPHTEAELRKLPGIGSYTAAAIAAIAFNKPANVVDGNVERVMARLFAIQTPLPTAKPLLTAKAAEFVPETRAGDYAQALMDLGATICTPRVPQCPLCPLKKICQAESPELLPARLTKTKRPQRRGVVFVLEDKAGRFWLRQRADKGLLGGMLEFPSSPWEGGDSPSLSEALTSLGQKALPQPQRWRLHPTPIKHVFTHFELSLQIATAQSGAKKPDGLWLTPAEASQAALPGLMLKVLKAVLRDKKG